jgi:hypothetical protein
MSASHSHVAATARDDNHEQHIMAMRLMQHPGSYTEWEVGHSRLMQQVCQPPKLRAQVVRMRAMTLRLIHRRAVFEYLRDRRITGSQRHRYIEYFYGPRDYASSLIIEHGYYTRSRVSASCSRYIGTEVLRDPAFAAPLVEYEQWYGEYFRMFCDLLLAGEHDTEITCDQALLPFLRQRCDEARELLIRLP